MREQNTGRGQQRAGAVIAALALTLQFFGAAGQAHAATGCSVVGTWTDLHSGTAKFKGNKIGVATAPNLCPSAYALKVTTLTATAFDMTGTSKNTSCHSFTVALTFKGTGCDEATGEVIVADKGSYHDVWTKSPAPRRLPPAPLRDGLK